MAISRMQQPRQMYNQGGLGALDAPRQGYFLGKLVKKATRAVKKVVKSPIGKAAIAGAIGFGIPGTSFGGVFGKLSILNHFASTISSPSTLISPDSYSHS